jgi:DNA-binding MarR family transcriptional regulator
MDRHILIQGLLRNMDALGRAAMGRHAEHAPNTPTHAQIGVMFIISYQGPQSIKQLAARFGMTSSAATQLVNGLVKEGFCTRQEDSNDRRRICVTLTQKGKRTIEQAKKKRLEMIESFLQPLNDSELLQLQKIHQKIVEHIQIVWTKK